MTCIRKNEESAKLRAETRWPRSQLTDIEKTELLSLGSLAKHSEVLRRTTGTRSVGAS